MRIRLMLFVLGLFWIGGLACGRFGFEGINEGVDGGDPELDCPLGVDEGLGACYLASNISADFFEDGLGDLDFSGLESPVVIDSESGSITSPGGVFREEGLSDASTSTSFRVTSQEDGSSLGVLSVNDFILPEGVEVRVVGCLPLAIAATGEVQIDGTLDLGAWGLDPGPGGFAGGEPGFAAEGPCGGSLGQGTNACPQLCASGGGGGGYGGLGGPGGAVNYTVDLSNGPVIYSETPGGDSCGLPSLIPLVGGSGGAGGAFAEGSALSLPGHGGSGGGAIQISAVLSIRIGAHGIITAPGEGGGESNGAGGAGGGAGGAIFLESALVQINGSAILAANGGAGGAGDCT